MNLILKLDPKEQNFPASSIIKIINKGLIDNKKDSIIRNEYNNIGIYLYEEDVNTIFVGIHSNLNIDYDKKR